ncbi:hypothetical protein [Janthinobacterium sp. 1_2014MBL_MicDiv]|uniref:hypothetical protein n=1 Tax=Janthinobacterium sp. 1_2014MBL_MicDiv TaxID=1644131 RepID=UPI0008F510AC|nr:hypothetical protein [Janthinobacterium sp. 1_2014MBL_MicDiv]APA69905.1 hypothetical protein YQ44_21295 [Janthinobacterium sp. 1_2014MBL_MicDiv]
MPASLIDNHLSFQPAAEILAARDKVLSVLNSFKSRKIKLMKENLKTFCSGLLAGLVMFAPVLMSAFGWIREW